jgi:DNA ligase-associated metallophosphoesterase
MLEMELANETLSLSPERAIYWRRRRTALIADPHFGKAAAFRSAGVPIPHGTTGSNLDRLRRLLVATGAERLVVLGDFLHARAGRAQKTLTAICAWRQEFAQLDIVLVRGNHDAGAGDPPPDWNIRCEDAPLLEPPFCLAHEPCEHPDGYVLAGHLHPAYWLSEGCGPSLRLPCFWFGERTGVLPAFGSFTGGRGVRTNVGDRLYLVGPERVHALPVAGGRKPRKSASLARPMRR